ncbi:OpgC domain-containing protein [Klebsiella variicola subsp. variicola]|nr:OpgC domain-containing protein [Klebsiella variicola subsp. variicola]
MSQVASAIFQKETDKSITWRYSLAGERDLRIDFMRGIVLVMMVGGACGSDVDI